MRRTKASFASVFQEAWPGASLLAGVFIHVTVARMSVARTFSLAHHALGLAPHKLGLARRKLGFTRHQLGFTRHEFGERGMPRPSVRCPLAVRVLREEPLEGKLGRPVVTEAA